MNKTFKQFKFFYLFVFTGALLIAPLDFAMASPLALVYQNEEAVMNGICSYGTLVSEGVVVSADSIPLSKNTSLLVAPIGEKLRYGSLLRVDMQLNAAVIKMGELVSGPLIQEAHLRRAEAVRAFLPVLSASSTVLTSEAINSLPSEVEGPFELKVNGLTVGTEPVVLKKVLKKSRFKLDVVYKSTAPVWKVDVWLESNPKLSFWREGKKLGPNDIPKPIFEYTQQIMFRPLASGKSIRIPIEVFFIEQEDYVWTFRVTANKNVFEKKVQVKFK